MSTRALPSATLTPTAMNPAPMHAVTSAVIAGVRLSPSA